MCENTVCCFPWPSPAPDHNTCWRTLEHAEMVLWWAVTNLTFCKNLSNCHVVESNYSLLSHYLSRQDSSSVCMNTIHSIYACYRSAVGSSLSFKSLFRLQNEGWDRIFTITDRHHSKSTGQ